MLPLNFLSDFPRALRGLFSRLTSGNPTTRCHRITEQDAGRPPHESKVRRPFFAHEKTREAESPAGSLSGVESMELGG